MTESENSMAMSDLVLEYIEENGGPGKVGHLTDGPVNSGRLEYVVMSPSGWRDALKVLTGRYNLKSIMLITPEKPANV